jgi:signal transduction histidine kinase/ActR/RegA family two-component response regulator
VAVCVLGGFTLARVQVTGPLYNRVVEKKDLIADILPPPAYLVEAFLTIQQINLAKATPQDSPKVAQLIEELTKREEEFRARTDYWQKHLLSEEARNYLFHEAVPHGNSFWYSVRRRFLPAIRQGKFDDAQKVLIERLEPMYNDHKAAIVSLVQVANRESARAEQDARDSAALLRTLLIFGAITATLLTAYFGQRVARSVNGRINELRHWVNSNQPGSFQSFDFSGNDELAHLAQSFASLTKSVEERDNHLNNTIAALRQTETDLIVQAQELDEALEAAKAASQAKSDFLANMSHELRTPLTAILGFADVLADTSITDSQRAEHVNTIRTSGKHLLGVINDILDLSKIEAGRMTVESIDTEPASIVEEIASALRVRATAKNISLDVDYATPVPRRITSDPLRLRQVINNLVGNAIKFTHEGRVLIRVGVEGAQESPVLKIDVVDSGIGMSEEQLARLFKPFEQADSSMKRRFGGTGLGLVISQNFVRMLGGNIQVSSVVGRGSTFSFTLPLSAADLKSVYEPRKATALPTQIASINSPPRHDLRGYRILMVDDTPDNRKLVGFLLAKCGAIVDFGENGQEAIDKALAAEASGAGFDAILLDMQMPVVDGYTAATELRRKNYTKPIIALTAHAMSHDREKCLSAGCTEFATKPVDREKLIATILACTSVARGEAA